MKNRSCFFYMVILVLSSFYLSADTGNELNTLLGWLDSEQGSKYTSCKNSLVNIYTEAVQESIPIWILHERINQGAAKNISPNILLNAVKMDFLRLKKAKDILKNWDTFSSSEEREKSMKALNTFMLGGVTEEALSILIMITRQKGRSLDDLFLLCSSLIQIMNVSVLSEKQMTELGEALLLSNFPHSGYSLAASFYLKAALRRIPDYKILEIIKETLKTGGGIIQMEQELNRRVKIK